MEMTPNEAAIIRDAIKNADCWGEGRISLAKDYIQDAGYEWTDEHELFVFEVGENNA